MGKPQYKPAEDEAPEVPVQPEHVGGAGQEVQLNQTEARLAIEVPPTTPEVPATAPVAESIKMEVIEPSEYVGELSTSIKLLLQRLDEYEQAMAPAQIHVAVAGAKYQVTLYRTLVQVFNQGTDDEFEYLIRDVFRRFHQGADNVYSYLAINRYHAQMALSTSERQAYSAIVNLIARLANPASRRVELAQIDIDRCLPAPINDRGRARMHAFLEA